MDEDKKKFYEFVFVLEQVTKIEKEDENVLTAKFICKNWKDGKFDLKMKGSEDVIEAMLNLFEVKRVNDSFVFLLEKKDNEND